MLCVKLGYQRCRYQLRLGRMMSTIENIDHHSNGLYNLGIQFPASAKLIHGFEVSIKVCSVLLLMVQNRPLHRAFEGFTSAAKRNQQLRVLFTMRQSCRGLRSQSEVDSVQIHQDETQCHTCFGRQTFGAKT